MVKECALNELSILDIDARRHDVFSVLLRLVELCRIAGVPGISLWQDLKDFEKDAYKPYIAMMREAQKSSSKRSRDDWGRIKRLFDKAESFADDLLEEVRFNERTAPGLGRALRLRGLALSLDSDDKWGASFLPVHVHAIDEESRSGETNRTEEVRHAAVPGHLDTHNDWPALEEMDRLRIRLENMAVNHFPASKYNGKHVNGTTNTQRRENASGPTGQNQYLAERNGVAVTDDVIFSWEMAALERVKKGHDCLVEPHGGAFHVYCDLGENIGYDAPTGDLISWIRVEWTSGGAVHSHPRRPRT